MLEFLERYNCKITAVKLPKYLILGKKNLCIIKNAPDEFNKILKRV